VVRTVEFRAVDSAGDRALELGFGLLEIAQQRGDMPRAQMRIEQRRIESAPPTPSTNL
jgi:hypothetical protein